MCAGCVLDEHHARMCACLIASVSVTHALRPNPNPPNPLLQHSPTMSTNTPMSTRAAMAPHTAATPALPSCALVRNRSSRMMGSSEAGAKVARKEMKKANQDSCVWGGGGGGGLKGEG